MINDTNSKPLITIGLSVFNGEDTLERTIESLLSQTYANFQLILADNVSTDSTPEICKKFEKKDSRVRYFRRNKKLHIGKSLADLSTKIETEFSMFAADDDIYEPTFIEKNLEFLKSYPNFVGSIGDIRLFGSHIKNYFSDFEKNWEKENEKKHRFVRPIVGTYEEKVKNILEFNWCINIYSIFRTKDLQIGITNVTFTAWDFAFLLNMIKYGDFHVLDEKLLNRDTGGETTELLKMKIVEANRYIGHKGISVYFPYLNYTIWCLKNLGFRIFLKHFSHFSYLNIHTGKKILRDIFN